MLVKQLNGPGDVNKTVLEHSLMRRKGRGDCDVGIIDDIICK